LSVPPQSVDRDALLRMAKSRAAALHAVEGRPSAWAMPGADAVGNVNALRRRQPL
jgi:hypothetical protein